MLPRKVSLSEIFQSNKTLLKSQRGLLNDCYEDVILFEFWKTSPY